jgi:DNA (cytosine-5)-methyltransferase 1
MREMHLFAGAGGGILGGLLLGHTTVCAVEIDPYCQKILKQRQADGILPEFPIHGDIKQFDGRPWKGKVDCVCGGFPCQDLSVAGKGAGIHGSRSSLFFELIRIVREVEPRFIFLENVPALLTRGIDVVLGALADIGFDAEWTVLSASDCGANHLRKRVWILCRKQEVADSHNNGPHGPEDSEGTLEGNGRDSPWSNIAKQSEGSGLLGQDVCGSQRDLADTISLRRQEQGYSELSVNPEENGERKAVDVVNGCVGSPTDVAGELADTECERLEGRVYRREDSERQIQLGRTGHSGSVYGQPVENAGVPESQLGGMAHALPDWVDLYRASSGDWWASEPPIGRLSIGTKNRAGRLRGLGNAQVPIVAATAFEILLQRYES